MTDQTENPRGLGAFIKADWPYIGMLILSLVGVALASIALEQTDFYWELLTPLFAAVCVYARWQDAVHRSNVRRLLITEGLHWGATFVGMRLLYSDDVSRMMNANGTALTMMIVLALGTFTAGAQIGAWRIAAVGAILGAAVPFVAFLERATLLVTLVGIALAGIVAFFLAHRHAPKEA